MNAGRTSDTGRAALRYQEPDELYAELFEQVQSQRVLADSKAFVDAVPRFSAAEILAKFRALEQPHKEQLVAFVHENFILPDAEEAIPRLSALPPIRSRIEELWDILARAPDTLERGGSLIPLPYPYIVPGGRFREIYYWDTYFTMLGLAASGRVEAIADMVANFAFLVDEIGFIPNGNRTYFCTRSQPPFFVLMVELLARVTGDARVVERYLPQLRREYEFWMDGIESLSAPGDAARRVVKVHGGYLNRYWDDSAKPRPESYAEDIAVARTTTRDARSLFRDIRAACESGWDFSSRWLRDREHLASIYTTEILPVDLNCLLFRLETVLGETCRDMGDVADAQIFLQRARERRALLQSLFFDETHGFFVDLELPDLASTGTLSLAAAYPLFLEVAQPAQAARVVARMREDFLAPGGWRTTTQSSPQQWDRPNGWAPLHWVTYIGMENYGHHEDAKAGAKRWVDNNLHVYRHSGKLLEKYNVEELGAAVGGGEYAVQSGFGWTNAVLLQLMNRLGQSDDKL